MKIINHIKEQVSETILNITDMLTGIFMPRDVTDYCDLVSSIISKEDNKRRNEIDDNYIFVNKDNSYTSVFDLQGTLTSLSEDELVETIIAISDKLSGYLKGKGKTIEIVFERDQSLAYSTLNNMIQPQLETAKRLGITTKEIIKEKVSKNSSFVAYEKCFLVIHSVMPKSSFFIENNDEKRVYDMGVDENNKPYSARFGQLPTGSEKLLLEHETLITRIKSDFLKNGKVGIFLKLLTCKETLQYISFALRREKAINSNFFVWGDDNYPVRAKVEEKNSLTDISNILPPDLSMQVFQEDMSYDDGLIKGEDYYFASLEVEMMPINSGSSIVSFKNFISGLSLDVPFRIRADISTGGLSYQKIKRHSLGLIGFLGSNKDIKKAFDSLMEIEKKVAVVTLKMGFATWGKTKEECKKNLSLLKSAVNAWGCISTTQFGDPFANFFATIPAFTINNPNTQFIAPLPDVLALLPIDRPANIWENTKDPVIFRTPDGKIYPVEFSSPQQDLWLTIISAPSGSGKSVIANSINLSRIHGAGLSKLPFVTVIDIGSSSSGLIQLIKDNLPVERKHEVEFIKLENSSKYVLNPFDTHLGFRMPTKSDHEFIKNLLALFCVEEVIEDNVSRLVASTDTYSLMDNIITFAYKRKATTDANIYTQGISTLIDDKLNELLDYNVDKREQLKNFGLTWWEVVDLLFENDEIYLSSIAQRYAVPVITEVSGLLNEPEITNLFATAKTSSGEDLIPFIRRSITTAISKYNIFSGTTTFELNAETRILSIDLEKVLGQKTSEGRKQSAAMYMFARQLAIKAYSLDESDVMSCTNDLGYQKYHLDLVRKNLPEKKITIYDECHNFKGLEVVELTLEKDAREGRKRGYESYLISQFLDDFSKKMRTSATTILIMRGNSKVDKEILKSDFDISEHNIQRLNTEATGPTESGSNFLAMFQTKKGLFSQILTNTEGSSALWSFSTTTEDMALRRTLSSKLNSNIAIDILSKEFPSGSAKNKIKFIEGTMGNEKRDTAVDILVKELLEKYKDKINY